LASFKHIVFLHGFLSSRGGTKATFLTQKLAGFSEVAFHVLEFNPTPRDFEYMTVTGEINRLRQYVLDHHITSLSLIGSSLGGQVALHYGHRYGGVTQMLLLAPALYYDASRYPENELANWQSSGVQDVWHDAFQQDLPLRYEFHLDRLLYRLPVPPPAPITIIHGKYDTIIPIGQSRQYATQYPEQVQLVEVDADHRLSNQLERIWSQVQELLAR
jgi:pimeloyl-ACP methyl ester carboxylesterase